MKNIFKKLMMVTALFMLLMSLSVTANAATKNLGKFNVTVGKTYQIPLKNVSSGEKLTCSSANKKIATVDKKGLVKGVKEGNTSVTVKIGKNSYKFGVKVVKNVFDSKVTKGRAAKRQFGNGINFVVKKIYYKNNCMYVDGYLVNRTGKTVYGLTRSILSVYLDNRVVASDSFGLCNKRIPRGATVPHTFAFHGRFVRGYDLGNASNCIWDFSCDYRYGR